MDTSPPKRTPPGASAQRGPAARPSIVQGIHAARPGSTQEDLQALIRFFGLEPTGREMERITGARPSSLSRMARGQARDVRMAGHLAVLATFVQESEAGIAEMLGTEFDASHADRQAAMRRWLQSGCVWTSGGPMIPIDALADPDLAKELLAQVRQTRFAEVA